MNNFTTGRREEGGGRREEEGGRREEGGGREEGEGGGRREEGGGRREEGGGRSLRKLKHTPNHIQCQYVVSGKYIFSIITH